MHPFTLGLIAAGSSLLLLAPAGAPGQQRPTEGKHLILLVDNIKKVRLATNQPIRAVRIDNEQIARLCQPVKDGIATLEGLSTGTTRMTLTAGAGNQETWSLLVRSNQLILAVGQTVRLQMTTRRPLKEVFNQRPTIVRVEVMRTDDTTVLITGLAPGSSRITLTDIDGNVEVRGMGR